MAENVKTRILLRSDIASAWTAANPVLLKGEVGIEYNPAVAPAEGRVIKIKIGDGTTAWNALGYVADYDASIAAINAQITTLNGADTVTGSVSQKIKAAIDGLASVYQEKLPEGAATGKYLTADESGNLIWKAVADPTWANITGNIADNDDLVAEFAKKQNVISETNKLGAALVEETAEKKFVSQSEKEKIAKIDTIETNLGNKVDREEGKSLINVTDITKLAGIAEGAQVNVIEGIQVGGVDVPVGEGKKVNITGLATDANLNAAIERIAAIEGKEAGWNDKYTQAATDELLSAKANAADVYAKTEVYTKSEVDGKIAEIHKWSYSIVNEVPTTETAEEFVIYLVKDEFGDYKEYIKVNTGSAEAPVYAIEQLGDFHIDLSNYYTKEEVNTELAKKQNKLTAGNGVVISADNEISLSPEATKVNEDTFVFEKDLEVMYELGKYKGTLASKKTIPAAGKTFAAVWNDIFLKEENPKTTQPSLTVTSSNIKAYEAGTRVSIAYASTFSAGSYTYGPATGVTASNYKISFNGETLTAASGTFAEVQVTDAMNLKITGTFDHTAGAVPVTNIGNEYAAGQINAATNKAASVSGTALTGYRNMFFGTLTAKNELTSSVIRGLPVKQQVANVANKEIAIPVGALRVVFAVPSSKTITSITDTNGLGAQIFSSFTNITVNVEGAEGYEAKEYNVYYMDYATPNDKANSYKVTVA